jgi:radical SAM protein with 4Fe4S-binding SPASM domain
MENALNNKKRLAKLTDLVDSINVTDPPPFPNRVTIELTNQCNLKCTMCPRIYMKGSRGFMSMSLFKKIIDEVSTHNNIALVPFFRGEPLLHPDFAEMITYAKTNRISPIQLTTNATMMTEDIAQTLIDIELDFISFSVDSIDNDMYSKIRKGANLQKVIKNIEILCELKEKKRCGKPEIQVSVVKTENTVDSLDDFIAFWQGRVDRVRVYEEHSKGGNYGSLSEGRNISTTLKRQPCLKPFNDFVIYWDGSVALCNHDWDRIDTIGNVNHDTIEGIWNNEIYRTIRKAHIHDHSLLEELCRKCDHWKSYYIEQRQIGELYATKTSAASTIIR